MLEAAALTVRYGDAVVLRNVSLRAREGEVTCVLGPNGVGKTTLLRSIMGLVPPSEGRIAFRGEPIDRRKTCDIVRRGLTMIPEGRRLWPSLTVRENLEMGGYGAAADVIAERSERVYELFPRLRDLEDRTCLNLSGGEQQMVAIGRGLMAAPALLLMDEPSLGLAPLIVREMFRVIRAISERGTTVLLVEQNTAAAFEVASYGYVLETGTVALEGRADELRRDPHVKQAYLGL